MEPITRLPSNKALITAANTRLQPVIRFLHRRYKLGLPVAKSARFSGLTASTLYRRGNRFLADGLAGLVPRWDHKGASSDPESLETAGTKERLGDTLSYFVSFYKGLSPKRGAADLAVSGSVLDDWAYRLLRWGVDGLVPDWQQRIRDRADLLEFEVNQRILDSVESLSGALGSAPLAWLLFSRSAKCPFRLSVLLKKRRLVPESLVRAIRLRPVEVRAWRAGSGAIYVHTAEGKYAVINPRALTKAPRYPGRKPAAYEQSGVQR